MNKDKIREKVEKKLAELYSEICREDGLKGFKEGYIPMDMALKADKLVEDLTDRVDELIIMNAHRQRPAVKSLQNVTQCKISIVYDGVGEDKVAFFNESCTINCLERLCPKIEELQSKGYRNIAVSSEGPDFQTGWLYLSEYSISEIEDIIREDLEGEKELD